MTGLGHTVNVIFLSWFQGETDALVDGNDVAYLGLFGRFVRDVKAFLAPWTDDAAPLRWVTCLIGSSLLPVGYELRYTNILNVRGALMRQGWSDPEYRIVDSNKYSRLPDKLHLDTDGVVLLGQDIWAAYLSPYNNSMPLQEYHLGSIRTQLAEEFGIDLTIQNNVIIIDKRINKALSWILSRRKNWPWMEKDTSINVGEQTPALTETRYGAGIFSLTSQQVVGCTYLLSPLVAREMIDFMNRGHTGLMVQSASGTTAQLRQGYRGDGQKCAITSITFANPTVITVALVSQQGGTVALPTNVLTFGVSITGNAYLDPGPLSLDGLHVATRVDADTFTIPVDTTGGGLTTLGVAQIAKEFTIAQCYFELPEDYIRNSTAHIDEDIDENTLTYRAPQLFEREVRANRLQTLLDRVYTVVPDPIGVSSRKFVGVYPYFVDRNTLQVKYWGDIRKLVADADEPDVPRSDHFVVWYAAAWFVAQWQKDTSMVSFYRDGALNELERMAKEYQLSDDVTEGIPVNNSDGSELIRGPDGFPEFMEP